MANKRTEYIAGELLSDATLTSDIAPSAEAMEARSAVLHRLEEGRLSLAGANPAAVLRALLATPPQP
jgi:hypothetical protein